MKYRDDLPLISVTIPAFNHGRYLASCLDSLWFQDYPNLEIIVVNPASTDDTKLVLQEFFEATGNDESSFARYYDDTRNQVQRSSHPRYSREGRSLKVIHLESDPGLSESYNIGIKASSGEFISTVAADDQALPEMFSGLASALAKGADVAYSDMHIVDDHGRIVRAFILPDYDPITCLANWYLMGVSRLWRKSLHAQCGYFDSRYRCAHDYDLLLRFAEHGARFARVPRVLYAVRHHGNDRQTGSHSPAVNHLIHEESKEIALRARSIFSKGHTL